MNITWKDGVTTVAAAAAVVVERAHAWDYTWPLVSSARWTVGIIAALLAVGFAYSYLLDKARGTGWTFVASFLGIVGAIFAAIGLVSGNADYAVAMMTTTVVFWLSALVRHVTIHEPMTTSHA